MMRLSFQELVKLGHRRIAYLGFPLDEAFVHCLRMGYISAHEEFLGRPADPRLIGQFEDEPGMNAVCIAKWLDLPKNERPTAFVIGAGNEAWHDLETCLAQTGHVLGVNPHDFAAAGITSLTFTLMFGEAAGFQGIEIDKLAEQACPGLLRAILKGQGVNPIFRFLPNLSPIRSLRLLSKGVSLTNVRGGND
jgi:LacI family transcriptional regulator